MAIRNDTIIKTLTWSIRKKPNIEALNEALDRWLSCTGSYMLNGRDKNVPGMKWCVLMPEWCIPEFTQFTTVLGKNLLLRHWLRHWIGDCPALGVTRWMVETRMYQAWNDVCLCLNEGGCGLWSGPFHGTYFHEILINSMGKPNPSEMWAKIA
jgi:hypothetical protein